MSTRDLRFRFIGDAQSLKGTFGEVAAGAQQMDRGLQRTDVSASNVGKTFTRTGKLFKSTGKVLKNSGLDALSAGSALASVVPQASGLASGIGAVTIGADALQATASSLGTFALPVMAAAAIAAAGAYAFLHEDTSAATDAFRRLDAEQAKVKAAHREVAVSAVAQREATRSLAAAQFTLEGAQIGLIESNRNLADTVKEYGRGSLEARTALLQQAQAEQAVKDARRDALDQARAALAASEKRSKASEAEARAVRDAKKEADKYGIALKTGFINGKDAVEMKKRIAAAADLEAKASLRTEARHRANAKEARAAANTLKGETNPALVALRKQLIAASNTELDMANAIAAMRNLASATGTAASGVQHVYDLLRNPPAAPTVSVRTLFSGGGGGGKPGGGKKGSDEFTEDGRRRRGITPLRGELSALSFSDVASTVIDARHRDDSLQDKVAGSRARSKARGEGITNPDKLDAREEKAVLEVRKKELNADATTVKGQRVKLRQRIVALRKRLASQRGSRRTAKKEKQSDWDDRIRDTLDRIRGLWDQDRAMARDLHEIQAEAKEIGYDIGNLDDQLAGMPNAVPDDGSTDSGSAAGGAGDAPVTERDYYEAEAAKARLTEDTADDAAAAGGLVGLAEREYAAAAASNDPRRIREAADTLAQARANLDALTKNTDALDNVAGKLDTFGGSSVVSFRGQDFVLRSLAPPSSDDLRELAI